MDKLHRSDDIHKQELVESVADVEEVLTIASDAQVFDSKIVNLRRAYSRIPLFIDSALIES